MWHQHFDELLAACSASVLWLFAQTADLPPFFETALENSAWAGLVFFFVYTAWKREERITERITELERQTPALLERVLASMDRNSDVVMKLNESINKLKNTVEDANA